MDGWMDGWRDGWKRTADDWLHLTPSSSSSSFLLPAHLHRWCRSTGSTESKAYIYMYIQLIGLATVQAMEERAVRKYPPPTSLVHLQKKPDPANIPSTRCVRCVQSIGTYTNLHGEVFLNTRGTRSVSIPSISSSITSVLFCYKICCFFQAKFYPPYSFQWTKIRKACFIQNCTKPNLLTTFNISFYYYYSVLYQLVEMINGMQNCHKSRSLTHSICPATWNGLNFDRFTYSTLSLHLLHANGISAI